MLLEKLRTEGGIDIVKSIINMLSINCFLKTASSQSINIYLNYFDKIFKINLPIYLLAWCKWWYN